MAYDSTTVTWYLSAVGHGCDLALLAVQDPAFWEGTSELQLGALPDLQEEVAVLGYPIGGER